MAHKIVDEFNDVFLLVPIHKNPIVREPLKRILGGNPRILLTEPLSYEKLVAVIKSSKLIISDSGGIQEEAPTFGKPVLVLRENTERIEVIEHGVAKLVGTNKETIFIDFIGICSILFIRNFKVFPVSIISSIIMTCLFSKLTLRSLIISIFPVDFLPS